MKDAQYFATVAEICSVALRSKEVSGTFETAANTLSIWQQSIVRLEAAKAAEANPALPTIPQSGQSPNDTPNPAC